MTTKQSSTIVQKVWNYAHILKDDGLAFMDYTEQITYLLFLKMAWEQRDLGAGEIPSRYTWGALRAIQDKAKLLERYHQGRRFSSRPVWYSLSERRAGVRRTAMVWLRWSGKRKLSIAYELRKLCFPTSRHGIQNSSRQRMCRGMLPLIMTCQNKSFVGH